MSDSLPLVIINPTSARGRTGAMWAGVASDLRAHFGAFQPVWTKAAGDARRIAREESARGRRFIIACGGDGTINEVANGIIESGANAELGILPSGTGGDFRRTLNIPTNARDAAFALRTGRTRRIDVGQVIYTNHDGATEQRYFLGVASAGMGGAVIEEVKAEDNTWLPVSASRILGGKLFFAAATLRTTMSFEKPTLSISLDDKRAHTLKIVNLCIANARYFGGGMKIAPHACLDDGLLDIVAIGDLDRATILTRAPRIYQGTHLSMEMVHHATARRITVRPANENEIVKIEVDGELVGRLPATFEIVPGALLVRCPCSTVTSRHKQL
jgi:YegS/Rv2252/BmrU family lipid kinase